MARALTESELALLRSDGQFSRLGMFIYQPPALISGTVSAFTATGSGNYDQVDTLELTSVTGSGTVLDGQTVYVSATGSGNYDLGMVRARSLVGSTLTIGETSDIPWAAGATVVTVMDDYQFWSRRLRMVGDNWVIDGTLYSDQYTDCDPVPVLGPQVAVIELSGSSAVFTPTAGSSWVIGSTVASYAWSASSGSISDASAASPTITFVTPGTYRVSCAVTSVEGKTFTGHRLAYVYASGSPQISQFTLESCSGDYESGGWSFSVTMYDQSQRSLVVDRALCCVFAKDYYGLSGSTAQSIGHLEGYENVLAIGWIDGESITWNPQQSSVKFTVLGPGKWLDMISGYPASVTDMQAAPGVTPTADWPWMPTLSADKALWHLTHWRSTIDRVIDVMPTNDTRRWYAASAPSGTLWSQIDNFMNIRILAKPLCDQYGRLFVRTDPQYILAADRTGSPTVMAITKPDWKDEIGITRQTSAKTAMLDADAIWWNATSGSFEAVIGRANGNDMRQFGAVKTKSSLAATGQSDCNDWAGLLIGRDNNEYPSVTLTLAQNNRAFDIAPAQYATLTISAADTPRGISFTDKRFIPRSVSYEYDKRTGQITTALQLEGETFPELSTTVDKPPIVYNEPTIPDAPPAPNPLPPIDPGGPVVTPPTVDAICRTTGSYPPNGPYYVPIVGTIVTGSSMTCYMPSWVRMSTATNRTQLQFLAQFQKSLNGGTTWIDETSWDPYVVDAFDNTGSTVATGSWISGSLVGMNNKVSQLSVIPFNPSAGSWSGSWSGSATGSNVEGYRITVGRDAVENYSTYTPIYTAIVYPGDPYIEGWYYNTSPGVSRSLTNGSVNMYSGDFLLLSSGSSEGYMEDFFTNKNAYSDITFSINFSTQVAMSYYVIVELINNHDANNPTWKYLNILVRDNETPTNYITLFSGAEGSRHFITSGSTYNPFPGPLDKKLYFSIQASWDWVENFTYGMDVNIIVYGNSSLHRALINSTTLYNICQHT